MHGWNIVLDYLNNVLQRRGVILSQLLSGICVKAWEIARYNRTVSYYAWFSAIIPLWTPSNHPPEGVEWHRTPEYLRWLGNCKVPRSWPVNLSILFHPVPIFLLGELEKRRNTFHTKRRGFARNGQLGVMKWENFWRFILRKHTKLDANKFVQRANESRI